MGRSCCSRMRREVSMPSHSPSKCTSMIIRPGGDRLVKKAGCIFSCCCRSQGVIAHVFQPFLQVGGDDGVVFYYEDAYFFHIPIDCRGAAEDMLCKLPDIFEKGGKT